MTRKRPPAEDPEDAAAEANRRPVAGAAASESYGPLAVERHRKDDGRALILYRRREPA